MGWGTGSMMKMFKKWYSVTGLLAILLLIYTTSLLIYRAVFESMETQRMLNAFPDLWSVVEDTELLKQERYEEIPIHQFPHSAFIVLSMHRMRRSCRISIMMIWNLSMIFRQVAISTYLKS